MDDEVVDDEVVGDRDVQRLLDIEAIKQLKARYCRCVDTQDFDGLRRVFTEDAFFDLGVTGQYRGADKNIEAMRERRKDAARRTVHQVHAPEIEITGPDTATGIWALSDIVDVEPRGEPRQTFMGYGHYHEEYRREADGWKISSLRISRLRFDFLPVDHYLPFPPGAPQLDFR